MQDQARYQEAKRVSIISLVINIFLTVIKAFIGVLAGSTALVADAFHSASDLFGTIILLQGLKIAHKPPDASHPYGHHRAETITSKILAIILILTAVGIGYEALKVLQDPGITPPDSMAIYIALVSIISKEALYRYTVKIGRKINSPAVIADAWHNRSDAFSSIAALIGITGARFGYTVMDPLAGIFVSILILKTGISIYKQAILTLMDTAPSKEVLEQIREAAFQAKGIKEVQDIRVRQYGSKLIVDMKVCVNPNITVEEGHGAAARAKENLMKSNYDIQDVLIHVNPCRKIELENCEECNMKYKSQD
ncbi:cation diffusion facilitator family transporter [Clostridium aceticum]|uniref:Cation diffusion facilitator family transporter n=1 Tax=Clostridium aceticum TaxID=84022 RepID=A0A0D8IC18_9CLOT|nr:cation diffusion facilitator family transporter [Clostridium aceticum]AKL94913.1 cation diffusion facilitator family transporter [Clostridium aceticum]KJF27835.1 cation transporter [Clostridium aceticum]